jgi:hypothetical protein
VKIVSIILSIVAFIICVALIIHDVSNNSFKYGYLAGQIDYANGVIKVEQVITDHSEKIWATSQPVPNYTDVDSGWLRNVSTYAKNK